MGDEPTLYENDTDATTDGWVTSLQLYLRHHGHDDFGDVDGKFGWRTAAAVVDFQRSQGFAKTDGIAGNQTWAALMGREPEPPGRRNGPRPGLRPRRKEPTPTATDESAGTAGEAPSATRSDEPRATQLEQAGHKWRITFPALTDPAAVGRVLWPSGVPAQVGIEPGGEGVFEISGLDSDAFDALDDGYAKWFFDMGWRGPNPASVGNPLHTVRIWFKSFIPVASVDDPIGTECFKGDERGFSSDRGASARMHSEIVLQELHLKPSMTEEHWCGETHHIECDSGRVLDSATAPTDQMRFYNFRAPGTEVWNWDQPHPPPANPGTVQVPADAPVSVDYTGVSHNPLVMTSPGIDMWAHIELDLNTGLLSIEGAVDEFPAFEGYVLVNEQHGPFSIFAFDGDGSPTDLFGGASRSFSETLSLGSYAAMG